MNSKRNTDISRLLTSTRRAATSRPASWLLLCVFFWTVAAAGFSGFVNKWGLMGDAGVQFERERYGLELMLNATASKPFVYRQLAPGVAHLADRITPGRIKKLARTTILPPQEIKRAVTPPTDAFKFHYIVIYYLSFIAYFLSLFVLRRILLDLGIGELAAMVAPAAFILALPYVQTVGGYYYDGLELLFMSTAFFAALRGNIPLLLTIILPATWNKETFIFFLPALFPLLRHKLTLKPTLITTAVAVAAAGIVNVWLKLTFIGSSRGGVAELHILNNILSYLNPFTYLESEITYGIVGPARVFFGSILLAALILIRSWPHASSAVRHHLVVAALINLPLFLLFCYPGELRNLSFLYVGFVVLTAITIDRCAKSTTAG